MLQGLEKFCLLTTWEANGDFASHAVFECHSWRWYQGPRDDIRRTSCDMHGLHGRMALRTLTLCEFESFLGHVPVDQAARMF